MKRTGSIGRAIRKLLFLALLFCYLWVLMNQNQTKELGQEAITNVFSPIVEQMPQLVKGDARLLKRYYGIDADSVSAYYLAVPESGMEAEELLVLKVKTEEQKSEMETAILNRNEQQQESFDGYGAAQYELLKNYSYQEIGPYIFYGVSDNVAQWEQTFTQAVKK